MTKEEINANKALFLNAQKELPNLVEHLADLKERAARAGKGIGWIINGLKGKLKRKLRRGIATKYRVKKIDLTYVIISSIYTRVRVKKVLLKVGNLVSFFVTLYLKINNLQNNSASMNC